jgi:hypothetical protein
VLEQLDGESPFEAHTAKHASRTETAVPQSVHVPSDQPHVLRQLEVESPRPSHTE